MKLHVRTMEARRSGKLVFVLPDQRAFNLQVNIDRLSVAKVNHLLLQPIPMFVNGFDTCNMFFNEKHVFLSMIGACNFVVSHESMENFRYGKFLLL
jgi:hypothetical protein